MPINKTRRNAISLSSGNALAKLTLIFSSLSKLVGAIPIFQRHEVEPISHADPEKMTPEQFYINLFTSIFLVLAGGVFAGLTLGLMGQDEVYLKVILSSGDPTERKYARKVLKLIGRGKHWVLVTLLLSNVITNETLPIVLDRCLGGGWPAVVTSTASIVVFGEIIPQSISVRYGLQVGAMFAPFVLVLMYIMYPVAYPCALLLDHILGEDHGTVYKKSGLKTLVTLHKTMGVERLNQDEVTIISAVLDLKEKPVSAIMTPMDHVYTMSADMILDEATVEEIFNAGFSRIPIHLPNEPMNFIGMLLVRVLISYDPEDALPVASFPLATLPETGLNTSCLNILNYFQEGKSHMIVVSENPGAPSGAIGVLTLEDVIEELIGEEIVDESDVYVDINKNIKRKQPGPLSKRNLTVYLRNLYQSSNNSKRNSLEGAPFSINRDDPRSLIGPDAPEEKRIDPSAPIVSAVESAKTWKPKNPALNPLETNKSFVTIKRPAADTINSVIPGPRRQPPNGTGSKTYDDIHLSERGAIEEAKRRNSLAMDEVVEEAEELLKKKAGSEPNSRKPLVSSQQFLLPKERNTETDLSEISGAKDELRNGVDHYEESSVSYRNGGIIESVINVQGVHKTIIEHVSDEENETIGIDFEGEGTTSTASSSSSRSKNKSKKKKRSDLFNMNHY